MKKKSTSLFKRKIFVLLVLLSLFSLESFAFTNYYVSAKKGNDTYSGKSVNQSKKTIQAAINAASGHDMIYVYPGEYIEMAPLSGSTLFKGATYQFGLFISAVKSGISIVGVNQDGDPVSDYSHIAAKVQLNATNDFGLSGIFVEGDNVTITGLNVFLDPAVLANKTVEVIGENFTMKYCRLTDGGSLYINDWRFNDGTNVSHITKYRVEGNRFEFGTSLDISDGAGKSGVPDDRKILNNYFDGGGYSYALVSFNGSGTGVPWFVHTVGGAVIEGNTFVNGDQYIRHRGVVDNGQFDWKAYWNNNNFDKSVITLSDEAGFTPRVYAYVQPGDGYVANFTNVRRIGSIIQADVSNVAQNGDLVKVGDGTYAENIVVDKEVEIRGNSQEKTIIVPAISNPNCGGGGGGSLCGGSSNVILVQANNVTIDQLTVDGDNPKLTSTRKKLFGGAGIDARNGIITNHTLAPVVFNNLNVNHVTVKNIFLRGIYASSGGSFNFADNTVSNVQADPASIAMFNFGGSGSFTNNKVSNANDGISSNWSTGTVYTGNTVTNSGSGIHTDNNSGGTADLIQNNLVKNSTVGGYGIWVFAPSLPVQVTNNTVSNVDVGLTLSGQNSPVTVNFSGNTVNGQSKTGTTGVYITTSLFRFGSANVSAVFQNNFINNNTDGFYLESEAGYSLALAANNNSISNNANSNVSLGVGNFGAGTFSADMNCNWWGTALKSAVNASIIGTGVNHYSWLGSGKDVDMQAPGFQPAAGSCASAVSNAKIVPKINPLCSGKNTGSVTISFDNGFKPLSYTLDGRKNDANISGSPFTINGLSGGVHTVILTDGGGNTTDPLSFTLMQPAPCKEKSEGDDGKHKDDDTINPGNATSNKTGVVITDQSKSGTSVTKEADLNVIVLPNPSNTYFTLQLSSKDDKPVNLRVLDASGRIIDAKSKIGSNSTLQIGYTYSSGVYYAELIQGTKRKVVLLIKGKG